MSSFATGSPCTISGSIHYFAPAPRYTPLPLLSPGAFCFAHQTSLPLAAQPHSSSESDLIQAPHPTSPYLTIKAVVQSPSQGSTVYVGCLLPGGHSAPQPLSPSLPSCILVCQQWEGLVCSAPGPWAQNATPRTSLELCTKPPGHTASMATPTSRPSWLWPTALTSWCCCASAPTSAEVS